MLFDDKLAEYDVVVIYSIFNEWSLFNALLFTSLFAAVLYFLCRKTSWMERVGLGPFLSGLALTVVRLLLPIEMPFVQIIGSWTVLPAIRRFFCRSLFSWQGHEVQLSAVLGAVWLGGTVFLLCRLLWQWIRYQRQMARYPLAPAELMEDIRQWIPSFQGEVRMIPRGVPYVSGFFYPTVFLPQREYSQEELRLILLHEWEHFCQRDQWSKLLCHLLCCLVWWNPLLWMLKRQMDRMLELQCDFAVLRDLTEEEQQDYYSMLLREYQGAGKKAAVAPGIPALAGEHRHEAILQRFQLGLNFSQVGKGSRKWGVLLSAGMVLAFCLSYGVFFQPQSLPEEVEGAITSFEGAYLTPNEDGTYTCHTEAGEGVVTDISVPPLDTLPIVE